MVIICTSFLIVWLAELIGQNSCRILADKLSILKDFVMVKNAKQ